jgi:hypothetical protein
LEKYHYNKTMAFKASSMVIKLIVDSTLLIWNDWIYLIWFFSKLSMFVLIRKTNYLIKINDYAILHVANASLNLLKLVIQTWHIIINMRSLLWCDTTKIVYKYIII